MNFKTSRAAVDITQFLTGNRSTNSEWPVGAAKGSWQKENCRQVAT
jgi:hypothetical protein